jgi:phosphatidylserine/phosphatidylglycerophosphate/cardiolipin synthase-like enzyme
MRGPEWPGCRSQSLLADLQARADAVAGAAARGTRLAKAVSRVTGRAVLAAPTLRAGHSIELLECGAVFFPTLEAAIDAARSEVHLETYILHDDPSARRVIQALVRAAGRGVAVRLAVDGFAPQWFRPPGALIADSTMQLRPSARKHRFALTVAACRLHSRS